MRPFHYNGHPARVIFGSGTISQLPDEVARLGLERALVLATPTQEAERTGLRHSWAALRPVCSPGPRARQ